jgi:hypothetical membrane protein
LRAFPSKIIGVLMVVLMLFTILSGSSYRSFILFIILSILLNLFGAFNVEEYYLSLNRLLIFLYFFLLFNYKQSKGRITPYSHWVWQLTIGLFNDLIDGVE